MDASKYASLFSLLGEDDDKYSTLPLTPATAGGEERLPLTPETVGGDVPLALDKALPASPKAPTDTAQTTAPDSPGGLRSLADKYGVTMNDVMPVPRAQNESRFAANIGRAGDTIGAAFAGVKPNTSFYDNLERQGASDAAGTDARNDAMARFKQQLMLKVASDKQKNAPMSPAEFKAYDIQFSSDPYLKDQWEATKKAAAEAGIQPNVELFAKQATSIRGQGGASERAGQTDTRARELHRDSQDFTREMASTHQGYSLDKAAYDDQLRLARDARDASIPDRAMLGDAKRPPTPVMAKEVREIDADAQFILPQIEKLRNLVKQTGPDVLRVIPGMRGQILSLQQSIAAATLRANGYGTPTGSDWEQVYREIGDPTKFVDLVTSSQDDQLSQAAESIKARTEARAREYGYGPFQKDSGLKQAMPTPQRPDNVSYLKSKLMGPPPAANTDTPVREPSGAAAPVPGPTPPKPGMVRIMDPNTGKRGWAPAGQIPAGTVEANDGR